MTGKTKVNKRRSNPLMRSVPRRPRPRLAFNGQSITSSIFLDQSATGGTTVKVGSDWQSVDCSSGEAINRNGHDVVKHYQEYKYLSAQVEWIPNTGPASTEAPARIFISYIDNPELIVTYKAATDPNRATIVKNVANMKSFNAWERFTFRVPLSYRRKWFNVNPTIATPSNEETDRSIQGLVVIAYNTVADTVAGAALGHFRMVSTTMLQGFTATILT